MEHIRKKTQAFLRDEEGLGTLEMLLILAIIVVIAIAFRKWIIKWVTDMFTRANNDINNFNSLDPQGTPSS